MFVVSLMVLTLNNTLIITTLEAKAITVLERIAIRDEMHSLA